MTPDLTFLTVETASRLCCDLTDLQASTTSQETNIHHTYHTLLSHFSTYKSPLPASPTSSHSPSLREHPAYLLLAPHLSLRHTPQSCYPGPKERKYYRFLLICGYFTKVSTNLVHSTALLPLLVHKNPNTVPRLSSQSRRKLKLHHLQFSPRKMRSG
jgi:hypothetical protein